MLLLCMEFLMPPLLYNEDGSLRKAGLEIEFGAVELDECAKIIQTLFGGEIIRESSFVQEVKNTQMGDFHLKMDSRILTEKPYETILDAIGIEANKPGMENFVENIASVVVPYEIGTPPIPITDVAVFEKLRMALQQSHAKGTRKSILSAYATHVNIDIPSEKAESLLAYVRAFLLLYPQIYQELKVYFTRKISTFIHPFPDEYINLIFKADYHPTLEQFIEDYHTFNPHRNRPLDMYPVFACLMPDLIATYKDLGNVKPRRTFHYRLPNSEVDNANWTLAEVWNTWIYVEILASKPDEIKSLCNAYTNYDKNIFQNFNQKWAEKMNQWLNAALKKT